MNQETLLQTAHAQVNSIVQWFAKTGCSEPGDEITFVTFVRPSGVVDLAVVCPGGGYVSDSFLPLGYVTKQNKWVEGLSDDTFPCNYYEIANQIGDEITIRCPVVA